MRIKMSSIPTLTEQRITWFNDKPMRKTGYTYKK